MSSEKLYEILAGDRPKEIPWEKAAAQFVKLKMASGGLIPEQIEELHALAKQAERVSVPKEELEAALKKGVLSGVSGSVRGDISRSADVRRKRGENVSKNVGTLAGILGGGAAGKKLVGGPAGTLGGAALGALVGHGTGKAVGQEIDRARIKSQGKKSSAIEKQSGLLQPDQPRAKDVIPGRGPEAREARTALRDKLRAGCPGGGVEKNSDFGKEARAAKVVGMLLAKKASLQKRAQGEEEAIPVEYLESMEQPDVGEGEGLPPELEQFLQAQQEVNEVEFFKQKADDAEMRASQAQEQADQAAAIADQAQQQSDMQAQQSDMQQQSAQQQAQLAQQQSQMAAQDSVNARNEALSAQQQNIQMRQAFTAFRQQLMDLVAQDPTTMMPPPAVSQGPMPGAEEAAAGPPQEAGPPPGAEGMPPGAPGTPPGVPPGAEGAMPPPGAEMAPPGPPAPPPGPPAAPPGMPPGPPAGPPAQPPVG